MKDIDLNYIKYKLQPILRKLAKGRKGEKGKDEFTKVYPSMIENIKLSIPINDKGNISLQEQEQIVEKVSLIGELRSKTIEYKEKINTISIDVGQNFGCKEIPIGLIFDLPPIKGLTKKFINSNLGEIPVYGGRQYEEPIGFVKDELENVKYFENCLAWNREGSVGYVFWHKHKFTTNDHHRPLIVKDEFADVINLDFMRKIIQETLLSKGFKWSKTASKEKVAKIKGSVPKIVKT